MPLPTVWKPTLVACCGLIAMLVALPEARAQAAQVAPPETALTCQGVPPQTQALEGSIAYIYRNIGTRDLKIHVFKPAGARGRRPAILFFFGGGFRNGQIDVFRKHALAFVERGYVAAIADYRVLCRDGSNPVDSVSDGEAAWAWLKANAPRLGADPRRLVISGGSAGGLVAAAVGMRAASGARPAAMVLFNPALDLRPTAGATWNISTPQAGSISPAALPLDRLPPTIIFHGRADTTIPIQQEREFCQRAQAARRTCELVEYDGYGHSFYHYQRVDKNLGVSPFQDTIDKSLAFLARVLGRMQQRARPRVHD